MLLTSCKPATVNVPVPCDMRPKPVEPTTQFETCGPGCFKTDRPGLEDYVRYRQELNDWYRDFEITCKKETA